MCDAPCSANDGWLQRAIVDSDFMDPREFERPVKRGARKGVLLDDAARTPRAPATAWIHGVEHAAGPAGTSRALWRHTSLGVRGARAPRVRLQWKGCAEEEFTA